MADNFIETYKEICINSERQKAFCSNAIEKDKRLFKILNSNIKTYNTYYKYLNDVYRHPELDNHQKKKKLADINLYSKDRTNMSVESKAKIALKIFDEIEKGSFLRDLMIFVFSLDSNINIPESAEFITDVLPREILQKYDFYLKEAYKKQSILNPIYGLFVFYSDKEFLYQYINYITDMTKDQEKILISIDNDQQNFINKKRIHNLQKGSLLNEALIGSLYFKLCELNFNEVDGYKNIIHKILTEYEALVNEIDLPKKPKSNEWLKLEKILVNLPNDEKKVLLSCFGNISHNFNKFEHDTEQRNIQMVKSFGSGYDTMRTAKSRVGQSKFRKNLINQVNVCKCRIKDCHIDKIEFLKASHILEWSKSSEQEKVDPNNGLLLCPIHDFLFDSHFISFTDNGKIMISKDIPLNLYNEFNINSNSEITIFEGNKKYLEEHRKEFYDRESI